MQKVRWQKCKNALNDIRQLRHSTHALNQLFDDTQRTKLDNAMSRLKMLKLR